MSKKTTRNFHVLHRCGNIGTEFIPIKEKHEMLRNVNEAEYHMIPGINATDCPSAGQCDLCPLSDKCVKLHELRTYEGLLPAMYNCGTRKTKTEKASGWGDEGLYPAGVE